ncbi:transcription factor of the MADS box [Serendipita sp. 405]|nr:transcription factor of the MADS box [Serendipita sp. 397]KAG8794977.1 transcription factor of the MADS box [Serendipita sp. 398]KAG8856267.1 transcription factor of the MADS box [Serendipita sp. 405]
MSTAAAPGGNGPSHPHGQIPNQPTINFQHEDGDDDEGDDDDEGGGQKKSVDKKSGRRKIKIEFINDKSRRHITFSKRKAGIMKKAYELSTLTGTQVLLLVVSETGLVYTFTTAKLQPLVTQPEGKNLIQACLNAPAGQIPTGAPLGQPGNTVHQANVHQPQQAGPVPVTHPASGVAQGLPPPTAMPPPVRNVAGGISIGDKRGDDMDDDDDDDEGSPSDEATSPMVSRAPGLQRHTSHHGAPGQPRGAANSHSARGAHHGVHPYAGGAAGPAREAHVGHRRRTSSSANASSASGTSKVTSPRMLHRQTSGMSDNGGPTGMDTQSPTIQHYPPHPGHAVHDPQAMYGYAPQQQPQQQYPPQMPGGPGAWGQVQPGVHPAHRR